MLVPQVTHSREKIVPGHQAVQEGMTLSFLPNLLFITPVLSPPAGDFLTAGLQLISPEPASLPPIY